MDAEDAYAKIRAGASLVQVYTGFIYGGPAMPRRVLEELPSLMIKDGYATIEEATGTA